jgi:hypothetical protein
MACCDFRNDLYLFQFHTPSSSAGRTKTVAMAAELGPGQHGLASLDKGHFRLFLASLPFVHLLNLLFHNANGRFQLVRVAADPLDLDGRKPLAGVLHGLAQRLQMPGPH